MEKIGNLNSVEKDERGGDSNFKMTRTRGSRNNAKASNAKASKLSTKKTADLNVLVLVYFSGPGF